MCHACITQGVKAAVSRRQVLGSVLGGAVGGTAGLITSGLATGGAPAQAQMATSRSFSRAIDLTHRLTADFPTFFGTPAYEMEDAATFEESGFNGKTLSYGEHIGTHFDAPIHFSADGATVDAIPVEQLVCPLAVIDVRAAAAEDPDYRLTPDDIAAFESEHGEIPEGACVAMLSGWADHVASDRFRNADADGGMHFPGFHLEAARFLMEDRAVVGIGVDTLSLDHGASADFAVHYAWLPSGRWGVENLAGLDSVPATGATLIAGAPTFAGGSGGPGRVIALV